MYISLKIWIRIIHGCACIFYFAKKIGIQPKWYIHCFIDLWFWKNLFMWKQTCDDDSFSPNKPIINVGHEPIQAKHATSLRVIYVLKEELDITLANTTTKSLQVPLKGEHLFSKTTWWNQAVPLSHAFVLLLWLMSYEGEGSCGPKGFDSLFWNRKTIHLPCSSHCISYPPSDDFFSRECRSHR